MTITTYLQQLESQAAAAGITLDEACRAAGVPNSTLWRWRKGAANPSETLAKKLSHKMAEMVREKSVCQRSGSE